MKAVILAGGLGSRISEETHLKPKPMIEIGSKPILWHIMKVYSHWGINDFVICCGYKGYVVKEYFSNYFLHTSDVTFDMVKQTTEIYENVSEPWRVTLIDTGETTDTGGRLRRVARYLNNERFCLTYGDGLSDINIAELLHFHESKNSMITLTVAQPPGRYGSVAVSKNGFVEEFIEKPKGDGGWVNAGFMVIEPDFIKKYTTDDHSSLEREGLHAAAADKNLAAFPHHGFWQAMDTLRDHTYLNTLWSQGNAPWKVWHEHQNKNTKPSDTVFDTTSLIKTLSR